MRPNHSESPMSTRRAKSNAFGHPLGGNRYWHPWGAPAEAQAHDDFALHNIAAGCKPWQLRLAANRDNKGKREKNQSAHTHSLSQNQ
jgi:hypothetical protein